MLFKEGLAGDTKKVKSLLINILNRISFVYFFHPSPLLLYLEKGGRRMVNVFNTFKYFSRILIVNY